MATEKPTEKLGRYEILAELGRGAMGVVYKAIDPLIDRTVAIKTIQLDLSRDELANFEERFYREAKSAGRLNHPNIVTIYDVGKTDNIAYMAMEFLEGQLLKEILEVHTAMSIDRIADIAAQVADGLAYAHENGIVHRDIKPANIMLVRGDVVKITDFGIAQMPTGSRTLAGMVLGSPKYMAPEQVVGKTVDGRSDLFSLGVVLYEMLTGEPPFDGDNINTTMYRIVNEAPVPPKTLTPRIPDVFNHIVAKALAKHPDERYQSARELAHDLRNYKDLPIPISASPKLNQPGIPDRKARPRNNIGEETVFLNPISGGLIGNKTATGDVEIIQTQTGATHASGPFFWQSKKILIPAIMILLLAFTLMVMRGRSAHQVALPEQTAVTTAPVLVEKPTENIAQANDASLNNKLSKAEPLVPEVQNPATPVTASSASSPPHKTLKHKITTRETPAIPPETTAPSGDALLGFAITPWGEVYVDGKKAGASPPLRELKIPAGKHVIEIRNLNFPPYSKTIDLKADSTQKIKYIFK
ncbi:MAG TPA: serine/threonine-protein kinase [Sulfuriferula sp.]|nr:serine/threonine-protein kinase [Sulfuriferula sp.]